MADRSKIFAPLPRLAKAALLATSTFVASAGALAQVNETGPVAPLRFRNDYFGYALGVGPRLTYSDNIGLANDGLEESEFGVGSAVIGSAIYSTRRFTGVADAAINTSFLVDEGELAVNQDVGVVGTATLIENLLFIDLAGATARQLAGDNARFSQNLFAARQQRLNVHNFAFSPYLNRRFNDGSAAELRYRFSQVFIDNDDAFGDLFNDDSTGQEIVASYNTGEKFDRLQVGVSAFGVRTSESGARLIGDFEYEQGSAVVDAQLALSERFSIAGSVGYDEVDTTAPAGFIPDDELSGVYWDAGFRARPGNRTNISLRYGRRYDDDFINADVRYQLSDRVSFGVGASRSFRTRAQSVSTQYEALQRRVLDFAEQVRGGSTRSASEIVDSLTRSYANRFDAQTIGIGVSNDAFARLSGVFGRTTVGAQANYSDTDFGFRQIETIGGGLSAQRQTSRRGRAYTNLFYRYADTTVDPLQCQTFPAFFGLDTTQPGFDVVAECALVASGNGKTNTVGGRLGYSYRVFQNVSAFGEFAHTQRFSRNPGLEYDENSFTAGLQVDF